MANSDGDGGDGEVVILAIIGVAVLYIMYNACQCTDSANTASDMRAPLLVGNHRLVTASRDADMGFQRCIVCAFENFKRLSFCSLCGAKLYSTWGRPLLYAGPSEELSERQRRARFRRDWTRKLDVSGKLFWFKAADWAGSTQQQPAFVLRFIGDGADVALGHDAAESAIVRTEELQTSDATRASLVAIEVFPPDLVLPMLVEPVASTASHDAVPTTESPAQEATELTATTEDATTGSSTPTSDEPQPQAAEAAAPVATEVVELPLRSAVARDLNLLASLQTIALVPFASADPQQLPLDDASHRCVDDWKPVLALSSSPFPTKFAHFVTTAAGLLVHRSKQYIRLRIDPQNVLADSVTALSRIPKMYIHSVLRLEFVGDHGVDVGAVQREWYVLLNQELADPANGVFTCVDPEQQAFYLNPQSAHDIGDDHLLHFFAAGRLVGRSLLDSQALHFHLALPLLKLMLGQPVSYNDLKYFDPEAYKSLKYVINTSGAEELGLTFSITELRNGESVEVDLIDDGRHVDVTDENKELYLERRFRYLLFESVSGQLYAFLKGVYEVVPPDLLALFDPEELDYVLCGSDEIDVDDWKSHTVVTDSLSGIRGNRLVRWFWEIVHEMPNEHRRRLLLFATGTSRVPLGGFRALTSVDGRLCPFTLSGVKLDTCAYIASHACFNRLDVPLYKSKTQLEAMLVSIVELEEHGFTTD